MILTNKKLLIIQDFLFIIISVFYIVFRYTFFRSLKRPLIAFISIIL